MWILSWFSQLTSARKVCFRIFGCLTMFWCSSIGLILMPTEDLLSFLCRCIASTSALLWGLVVPEESTELVDRFRFLYLLEFFKLDVVLRPIVDLFSLMFFYSFCTLSLDI